MKNYRNLEWEPVNRLLVRLSLPAMGLMILHALFGLLDTGLIARLGSQSLAAVTLCHPIQALLFAVASAVGTGVNSLMSRSLGEKNEAQCNNIAWHTLFMGLILGVLFTWIGFQWMDFLLRLMGAGPNTMEQCRVYLKLYLWAVPGILLPILFSGLVVGEGNTVLPLAVGLVETALDVLLDMLLIQGFWIIPPLGIRGAAVASILSQSVGAALYFFVLRRENTVLRWQLRDFVPEGRIVREMIRVGLPGLLPSLLGAVLLLLLNRMLMGYGYVEVAALGLFWHIRNFCQLPVAGLGQGSLPIAGFAFGARHFDRLKETVLKAMAASLCLLCIGWYAAQFHTVVLLEWFTDEEILLQQGAVCLKLGTLFLPLAGPFLILVDILQVTGMSFTAMWLSLLRLGFMEIPFLLLGAGLWGVQGIWLALAATDLAAALLVPGFLRIFWNFLYPGIRKRKKDAHGAKYTLRRLRFWLER